MKFISLLLIMNICFTIAIHAQNSKNPIHALNAAEESLIQDQSKLVPDESLKKFFEKKASFYLSGSSDLSTFSNYAILNTADGRLSLGRNFLLGAPKRGINNIITTSLEADVEDGFSTLYSSNTTSNNLGVSIKYTFIPKNSITFWANKRKTNQAIISKSLDDLADHQYLLNEKAVQIAAEVRHSYTQDSIKFYATLDSLSKKYVGDSSSKYYQLEKKLIKEFRDNNGEKYLNIWYEALASELESHKYFLYSTFNWLSISAYIPITSTEYAITSKSDDFLQNIDTVYFKKAEFGVDYSFLLQHIKGGNFLIRPGFSMVRNNSIISTNLSKTTVTEYSNIGTVDSLEIRQLTSRSAYLTEYEEFWTPTLSGSFTYFLPYKSFDFPFLDVLKSIGISIGFDKSYGSFNPLNVVLGFPMQLAGKETNSPVNFELQFKIDDYTGKINPDLDRSEKLIIGFNLSLPFGNLGS